MHHLFIIAQAAQKPSFLESIVIPMAFVMVIFYFIWFRPITKKQKAMDAMLNSLEKGAKVVTSGGLYGTVVKADDHVVVLQIADNTRVRVAKRAITGFEGSPEDKGER